MPTITDGAWFQMNGTTFSVVTMKGGTPTAIDSGSFNGRLGDTVSPSTIFATYEIYYQTGKVHFIVNDRILHTVSAASTTWANTMNFHAFMDSVNTGVASSVILNSRSMSIYRLGSYLTAPTSYFHANAQAAGGVQLKLGPGNIHRIAFQSLNNSVISLVDSTTTTTPIIWATTGVAAITQPLTIDLGGIPFHNGLRLYVTGANSQLTISYE
jgi:hypothetical protein